MEIKYVNENLWPGHLGYFFVVLSFGAAFLGLAAYFFYSRNKEVRSWQKIARTVFFFHASAVIGIFATLFYLIHSHQFQYNYVWAHSSTDLPAKYMISCFWEGQEGSFLLWTFWHCVLGIILIFTSRSWEGPVMVFVCLTQVVLTSMLLGFEIHSVFGYSLSTPFKIGSNPFTLLRQAFPDIPLFNRPNYIGMIADGRGLNPLLQNYWMVIHPPVLFLGFASTVVPFSFAMASLWNKRYTEWVRPALPWAIFGGMVLGTGILMGGAWAYEALSFGGFWAWDPVENASLVPWLFFIGGLHTMMVFRARKTSLGASYILIILTFLLILYSTFLTRSGILGDSSVHSFTDLGLSGQLLIFMFLFFIIAIWSLVSNWKKIPHSQKDDNTWSREFWMFIGSLILALSAVHIIAITSIPVFNKIFGLINSVFSTHLKTNYAKPADVFSTYHMLQVPFAILIAVLSATGQYFRYHHTRAGLFWKRLVYTLLLSIVVGGLFAWVTGLYDYRYIGLLWASIFSIIANADVFIEMFRKRTLNISGAAVAHIGFGFVLLGALVSNAKKEVISLNTERFQALENTSSSEQMENKVLFKDFPVKMSDYKVTYLGDSTEKNHIFFRVNYKKLGKDDKVTEEFDLHPFIIFNKEKNSFMTTSPSTRHYLTKDIFTHITSASNKNDPDFQVKYDTAIDYQVKKGQVISLDSFRISIAGIKADQDSSASGVRYKIGMLVNVTDGFYKYIATPSFILDGSRIYPQDAEIPEFGLKFSYRGVDPEKESHYLTIIKGKRPPPRFITLKAIVFPYINLLWMGSIIMIIGFLIALARRIREYKTS